MKTVGIFLLISAGISLAIALGLILSQGPGSGRGGDGGLRFPQGGDGSAATTVPLRPYTARDGTALGYRVVEGDPQRSVVLIHGSGWHGAGYMALAEELARQTGAQIIVPDLRGHGPMAEPHGDVAYIGQFEDDLADLLDHLGLQSAVFAGHSSGGGLVVRLAGGPHRTRIERAVLIAPFLKYNAPTTRPNSGGWAQPLTRRIIGLTMLNAVGISWLNHLTVIEFNLPHSVLATEDGRNATSAYSYRLNTGFAPRADYGADIAALPEFLLVIGAEDEAFLPEAFAPTMQGFSDKGNYRILPDLGHLSILSSDKTAKTIADFL